MQEKTGKLRIRVELNRDSKLCLEPDDDLCFGLFIIINLLIIIWQGLYSRVAFRLWTAGSD